MKINDIQENQKTYWKEKFSKFDHDLKSLGSETDIHKKLRYSKIARLFENESIFSVLDIGAGFGDFYNYLKSFHPELQPTYTGTEITEEFVAAGKKMYPGIDLRLINILNERLPEFDYVVFSGIFHQHGVIPVGEWEEFMYSLITKAYDIAKKGIAFNILSSFADFKREGNFYPDAFKLQSFIIKNLSRFVVIDQSYPLFETTYLVFTSDCIKGEFPMAELSKYIK